MKEQDKNKIIRNLPFVEVEPVGDRGFEFNANDIVSDKSPDALNVFKTPIEGILVVKRPFWGDERGAYQEGGRVSHLEAVLGREVKFLQPGFADNVPNSLKGFHAEETEKYLTPVLGKLTSVIADLRPGSETFTKWLKINFDIEFLQNPRTSIWVPKGFGNSYFVHPESNITIYNYLMTSEYDPKQSDRGVNLFDEELSVPWPVKKEDAIISERDINMPSLSEFLKKFR